MRSQIAHERVESGDQRHHVRLKVPVRVEIDGARYRVEDWSVGGFGVENVVAPRQPGERFRVRVILPFEDFELGTRVDAQMVYVDRDQQRFGCRFLALTAGQLSLFRRVADAYLAGEIVTADDLLDVHARSGGGSGAAWSDPATGFEQEDEPTPLARWLAQRRYAGYAGYAALALLVLLLLGLVAGAVVGNRYLSVEAVGAMVEAPVHRLRAPIAGLFTTAVEPGERVGRDQPLAVVRALDGTVAPLASPCACLVVSQPGMPGQYYDAGEALITLVEADQPPRVRAHVRRDDAGWLEVGDRATIRFPGRDGVLHGRIERIDLEAAFTDAAGGGSAVQPVDGQPAQVLIRPERPLRFGDVGLPVSVRFPWLPPVPGLGSALNQF